MGVQRTSTRADVDPRQWPTRLVVLGRLGVFVGGVGLLVGGLLLANGASTVARWRSGVVRSAQARVQQAAERATAGAAERAAAALPPPRPLTDADAAAVLADVQRQCGGRATDAQLRTLAQQLTTPGQQIVDPSIPLRSGGTPAEHGAVQHVRADRVRSGRSQGVLILRSGHAHTAGEAQTTTRVTIDPAGVLISSNAWSPAGVVGVVRGQTYKGSGFVPSSTPSVIDPADLQRDRDRGLAMTAVSFVNVALAGWLLVCAVRLLLRRPSAVRWFRRFSWAKLPAVVATTAVFLWLANRPDGRPGPHGASWAAPLVTGSAGALFPAVVLFTTRRRRVTVEVPTDAEEVEPVPTDGPALAYARRGTVGPDRLSGGIAVCSVVVAALSGLLLALLLTQTAREWSAVVARAGTGTPDALVDDHEGRYAGCVANLIVLGVMFLLACLLMAAAVQLLRSRPGGVVLHRLYAVLQVLASLALGVTLMAEIANSPASMGFYIGAVPGVIGCIYPVVLLIGLIAPGRAAEGSGWPEPVPIEA